MRMFITSKNKYLSNDMKIFGSCSIPLSGLVKGKHHYLKKSMHSHDYGPFCISNKIFGQSKNKVCKTHIEGLIPIGSPRQDPMASVGSLILRHLIFLKE